MTSLQALADFSRNGRRRDACLVGRPLDEEAVA